MPSKDDLRDTWYLHHRGAVLEPGALVKSLLHSVLEKYRLQPDLCSDDEQILLNRWRTSWATTLTTRQEQQFEDLLDRFFPLAEALTALKWGDAMRPALAKHLLADNPTGEEQAQVKQRISRWLRNSGQDRKQHALSHFSMRILQADPGLWKGLPGTSGEVAEQAFPRAVQQQVDRFGYDQKLFDQLDNMDLTPILKAEFGTAELKVDEALRQAANGLLKRHLGNNERRMATAVLQEAVLRRLARTLDDPAGVDPHGWRPPEQQQALQQLQRELESVVPEHVDMYPDKKDKDEPAAAAKTDANQPAEAETAGDADDEQAEDERSQAPKLKALKYAREFRPRYIDVEVASGCAFDGIEQARQKLLPEMLDEYLGLRPPRDDWAKHAEQRMKQEIRALIRKEMQHVQPLDPPLQPASDGEPAAPETAVEPDGAAYVSRNTSLNSPVERQAFAVADDVVNRATVIVIDQIAHRRPTGAFDPAKAWKIRDWAQWLGTVAAGIVDDEQWLTSFHPPAVPPSDRPAPRPGGRIREAVKQWLTEVFPAEAARAGDRIPTDSGQRRTHGPLIDVPGSCAAWLELNDHSADDAALAGRLALAAVTRAGRALGPTHYRIPKGPRT